MSEAEKYPKRGMHNSKNKSVKPLSASVGFFNPLMATAQICKSCGYIEFYCE